MTIVVNEFEIDRTAIFDEEEDSAYHKLVIEIINELKIRH